MNIRRNSKEKTMNKRTRYLLVGIAVIIAAALINMQTTPQESGQFFPGGRNIEAYRYEHSKGFPQFPDRANFIGTLQGNWYQMGRQFGEKAGQSTRYVSDNWWKAECELWGKAETLKAFALYEAQIEALHPGLVDFMKGISDGASSWLNESPYADPGHPLYATNYQRVLAVNLWDEWTMQHPRMFPDGTGTFGGSAEAPPEICIAGCSAFAARGKATMEGETISAHNRHSRFDPRVYEQVYILNPPEGNICWVLTNSPQVAANQVVNHKGVSVSLLYGGSTNPVSLDYNGKSYCAEGFGVPWFHLFLYVGTYADTAKEAIEMLTVGTARYRSITGRDTLLRGGGWNFLVADEYTLAVVEAAADRCAVRYAGDLLPFTGSEWIDRNYIAATNHFICDFSYDEHNNLTGVPMTIFGDGCEYDDSSGERIGFDGSGERFWTLMWDIKHNYGGIDNYRAQQIMSGVYGYEKETGEKMEVAEDNQGNWHIYGAEKPCTLGFISLVGGTCDAKIALLQRSHPVVYWTLGNPTDWQGAWDEFRF
jgi:hypothetical protein